MRNGHSPIILDNWLWVLSQLSTTQGVLGKHLTTTRGKRCTASILMFLREHDLIWSSKGTHPGYRLYTPLNLILFKDMVNLWSLSSESYIRRLLLQYGGLSLATVCRLPSLARTSCVISLDSVCHVVKTLRTNTFMMPHQYYPKRYTPVYGYEIAKHLARQGLVEAYPKRGHRLVVPHDRIRIGDIAPVVSTRCQTLSKILLLAADTPVTTLFTKGE